MNVRPIDANALKESARKVSVFRTYDAGTPDLRALVDTAPTLDYAPVVHGEFERLPEECIPNFRFIPVFCKTCSTTFATINKEAKRCTCCPYCGAKMDGGKEQ